jgi:SAM-dependent methyltransferase
MTERIHWKEVTTPYNPSFFSEHAGGSQLAAKQIVPYLVELLEPKSVCDVGCGIGPWAAAFRAAGVDDVLGVDGPWVDQEQLLIPRDAFVAADLTQPILDRRFDVVVCLEVAEHLPAGSGPPLIAQLCRLADTVVFSAAIPQQGGTGHLNERWPEYWEARFAEQEFTLIDCIRLRFWQSSDVEPWYLQNMFLYVSGRRLATDPSLAALIKEPTKMPLRVVHPELWRRSHDRQLRLGEVAALAPSAIRASARRALSIAANRMVLRGRRLGTNIP